MKSLRGIVAFLQNQVATSCTSSDPSTSTDSTKEDIASHLSAAFLTALGGDLLSDPEAIDYLQRMRSDDRWGPVAAFFLEGLGRVEAEFDHLREEDPSALGGVDALAERLTDATVQNNDDLNEAFWTAFFPEGAGIRGHEPQREAELQSRRTITVQAPTTDRLLDPGRQLLLTTNALFTVPSSAVEGSRLAGKLGAQLDVVASEPQEHWYDHPMTIGVSDSQNEVLHGLQGMDAAIAFEKERGVIDPSTVMALVMSSSVTHSGLSPLTREYLENLLARTNQLSHIDVYLFTEDDAQRLINETLAPAVRHYLPDDDPDILDVIGVDGPYGRHYSFLKAIAAWWSVLIDPSVKGCFKFDLDQTFPQETLVDETGLSAMEHFTVPAWGARGLDSEGRTVELGMMAGSLVNSTDIASSLFALDMDYPTDGPTTDEMVFWSSLPQALSTAVEMGTRYRPDKVDGIRTALERIHVTGGTTAIRVDALRRHRSFTPGFIGRAEDQAYGISVHGCAGPRLACLHNDGLIMRHDKESFAAEAIRSAAVAKLISDYERMILFSAYAKKVAPDVGDLKSQLDPFTGCFISRLPLTVTYLRFALRVQRFFAEGQVSDGCTFAEQGAMRLTETMQFVSGSTSALVQQLDTERAAWNLFYDALDAIGEALPQGDECALGLVQKAHSLLDGVALRST